MAERVKEKETSRGTGAEERAQGGKRAREGEREREM